MLKEKVKDKTEKVLFLNLLCILSWNVLAMPEISVRTAFIIEKVSGLTASSVKIYLYTIFLITYIYIIFVLPNI